MKGERLVVRAIAAALVITVRATAQDITHQYYLSKKIHIDSSGGAAYLAIDDGHHRLYGEGGKVIDLLTDSIVGTLPSNIGHGYALAEKLGVGVTRRAAVFNLTNFQVLSGGSGRSASAVVYDAKTERAFVTFDTVVAMDPKTGLSTGHIALGKSRSAVGDDRGHVFVVLNTDTLLVLDARRMTVRSRWLIEGCVSPYGMAVDPGQSRLLVSCANHELAILDSRNGQIITMVPTSGQAIQVGLDLAWHNVLVPGGDTLTVIHERADGTYGVAALVATIGALHSVAIDARTHRAYLIERRDSHRDIAMMVLTGQ
jgi:DNA-binding beta-propeller fold protein YncE